MLVQVRAVAGKLLDETISTFLSAYNSPKVLNSKEPCRTKRIGIKCQSGGVIVERNRIYILEDRCRDCGICVKACEQNAIVPDHVRMTCSIDDTKCVRCKKCVQLCPLKAIKEKPSRFGFKFPLNQTWKNIIFSINWRFLDE